MSTADTPGPTLESTVACVPMRNVNAVATGLAAANRDAGDTLDSDTKTAVDETPGSTRWPPMPTVDQTVDQMKGGCDGYDAMPFIAQPAVAHKRGCVRWLCATAKTHTSVASSNSVVARAAFAHLFQACDSTPPICSVSNCHGTATSPRTISPVRDLVHDTAATGRMRSQAAARIVYPQLAAM